MTMPGHRRLRSAVRFDCTRGFSLVEMLVALLLLGVVLVAGATLTDAVLRRLPRSHANHERWTLSLSAVSALREDVRRSSGFAGRPPGLDPVADVLVLDRSEGAGTRLVVWSAGPGRLGRRELHRSVGGEWSDHARREWQGTFTPSLRWRPAAGGRRGLVSLDVAGIGGGKGESGSLRFTFGLRP